MSETACEARVPMSGLDLYKKSTPVVEWLERQPRHTLAWLLAQYTIVHRMFQDPISDQRTFDDALTALRHEVAETKKMSRVVALRRRMERFTDAIASGRPLPIRRRKRKSRRRKAKVTA